MKGTSPDPSQLHLLRQPLEDPINPKHPLCTLARRMPWNEIEDYVKDLYHDTGRPAKPTRLMVSLLILKQLFNLSDESVVERWVENPYVQFFSGETVFQWEFPCHPTDLVYFRKRIGEQGVKKTFQVSIELHGKKAEEKEVLVDTTVQEKNITFPTDTKLYKRIIAHCVGIAKKERITLRQSYRRTTKKLLLAQRFRRRAGIEAIISHLKFDYRLVRNYLKGSVGDSINLMMAAAAFNFKKLMIQLQRFFTS